MMTLERVDGRPLRSRAIPLVTACLLSVALVGRVRAASADDEERRLADEAFESGKQAWANGDWAEACASFAKSQLHDPSPSTLVKIARCRVREGKVVGALAAYQQALVLNDRRSPGDVHRNQREELIRNELAALSARVPRLAVEIAPAADGKEITIDGVLVAAPEAGEAFELDEGVHEVLIRAPGFVPQRLRVELVERQRLALAVTLEPLVRPELAPDQAAASAPATSPPAARGGPTPSGPTAGLVDLGATPRPSSAKPVEIRFGRRAVALALGGAGLAGIAAASYFGVRTLLLVNRADCDNQNVCNPDGIATMAEARRAQTAGFVAAAVGIGLIGTGAALFLTDRSGAGRLRAKGDRGFWVGVMPRDAWIGTTW